MQGNLNVFYTYHFVSASQELRKRFFGAASLWRHNQTTEHQLSQLLCTSSVFVCEVSLSSESVSLSSLTVSRLGLVSTGFDHHQWLGSASVSLVSDSTSDGVKLFPNSAMDLPLRYATPSLSNEHDLWKSQEKDLARVYSLIHARTNTFVVNTLHSALPSFIHSFYHHKALKCIEHGARNHRLVVWLRTTSPAVLNVFSATPPLKQLSFVSTSWN